MSQPDFISFEQGDCILDWIGLTKALEAAHTLPKAEINDSLLYRGKDTLLSRAAWIDGMGILVKSATVFPGNHDLGKPMIHGSVSLLDDKDGALSITELPQPRRDRAGPSNVPRTVRSHVAPMGDHP